MTLHIGDLMRGTLSTAARSDVQVIDYWSEHNLDLLKQYIFTSKAPAGKQSSVDLLRIFCEAYAPGALENRFTAIATYGHGKSHFALALANFFGRPYGTEESKVALDGIRHAVPDDDLATYGYLESFRKQHSPYLVLLLRGDEPNDLPTKFHKALKEALAHDNPDSTDVRLPFWFELAEAFLSDIEPARQAQANAYLAKFQLDIHSLLSQVKDRQAHTHDICAGLFQELHHVPPRFEAGLSLAEVVKWVVEEKCGPGKPYAGLLVLFDEFSAFVGNYCHSPLPGTPLQDLLNGIADNRERAAFIAFAQHDPKEVARGSAQGETLKNILKELDRVPKQYQLHSSLEEVLESYLRKGNGLWLELLRDDRRFVNCLDESTDFTLQALKSRYIDDLKWNPQHFHEVVTVGCFPLHPLTTALLCSVELQSTTNPRSVLGFVRQMLDSKVDRPVMTPAGPDWVRATSLVDHFREMLGTDEWQRYKDALSALSLPDESKEASLLQAMLLQAVGKLSTTNLGYQRVIAELVGWPVQDVSEMLDVLTRRGIIRRDSGTGAYSLPPMGWGRGGEKLILEKMQRLQLDALTLESLRTELAPMGLGHIGIPVDHGHSDDWHAEQVLIERARVTRDYITGAAHRQLRWTLEDEAKARALVIWAIADTEDEVEWYRDTLPTLLGECAPSPQTPIVFMRPLVPSTLLVDRLKRYIALKGFNHEEKTQVGPEWHRSMREIAENELKNALVSFQRDCTTEVPSCFRPHIHDVANRELTSLIKDLVRVSYHSGPRSWFTQFKLSSGRLPSAVSTVCSWLMQSGKVDSAVLSPMPVQKDIVERYLRDSWHLLDSTYKPLAPNTAGAIYPAWQRLEQHFQAGPAPHAARAVLEELLNAPYGYDWNTLSLLFASWWAANRYEVSLAAGGPINAIASISKPREIVQKIGGWSVRRTSGTIVREEIEKLVNDVLSGRRRSKTEANAGVLGLEDYLSRDDLDPTVRDKVQEAVARLKAGLERAKQYDEQAKRIRQESERESLQVLLSCLSGVRSLPAAMLVAPEQPSADRIEAEIRLFTEHYVTKQCTRFSTLERLEDYTNNHNQLQLMAKSLGDHGLTSEVEKTAQASTVLQQARERLDQEAKKEGEKSRQLAIVQGFSIRVPASELRRALTTLEGMEPHPDIRPQWEQKRRLIAQELELLAGIVKKLDKELDQATDRRSVTNVRNQALQVKARCDDGNLKTSIEQILKRADSVDAFFGSLAQLKQHTRYSPHEFATDADTVRHLLEAGEEYLSSDQRAVAEQAVGAIENSLQTAQRQVREQLERLEKDLARGANIESVQRALERPEHDWGLLAEDEQPRLETLRQTVQDRLAEEQARRARKAEEEAELKRQQGIIQSLPATGPVSELRRSLSALDAIDPSEKLKSLWQQKRNAVRMELERLEGLPGRLHERLDRAADRRTVEACRKDAWQASTSCDEGEARQGIEQVLARCKALDEYLEQIGQLSQSVRKCPEDFLRDIAKAHEVSAGCSEYLREAQLAVAEQTAADIGGILAAKQRTCLQLLDRIGQDLERLKKDNGQPTSIEKIHRDLNTADWTYLPRESYERLQALKGDVQDLIDRDELAQVEIHFKRIRDPQQRRKCLEILQQLVEETV